MAKYDHRLVRTWARMGPRAVYGQQLLELAKLDSSVVALSADLGRSSGLGAFANQIPERYFNTGIAEQNLVGVSAGLARMGFTPFASTFAPFASLRAGDQVRMNMGYMQEPVKLVSLASGFALGFLGNSHFGIEDIAVMRSIPGINIVAPADCVEMAECLATIKDINLPFYVRLTGAPGSPPVFSSDYRFQFGRAVEVKPLQPITLVSHGVTVGHALRAVEELQSEGLSLGLVNMHTIKPLDLSMLKKISRACQHLLIFEEHSTVGGLGSAITDEIQKFENVSLRIHRFGLRDYFPKAGSYDYMLKTLGLDSVGIKNSTLKVAKTV